VDLVDGNAARDGLGVPIVITHGVLLSLFVVASVSVISINETESVVAGWSKPGFELG
jgi:hypothetical protein